MNIDRKLSNGSITATANGKTFTFPEGTTPDQMGEAIDEFFSGKAQQPSRERLESALRNAASVVDDEAAAPEERKTARQAATKFANALKNGEFEGSNNLGAFSDLVPQNRGTGQLDLPEFGTVDGNTALFGSDDGFVSSLKAQFGDDEVGTGQLIRDAAAGLFTLNPKARVDGIEKRFPQLKVTRFDDGANAVVTNPETGANSVVNAEGLSNSDLAPILGSIVAASPAGKAVQGLSGLAKVAGVGTGALVTDAALQGAEIAQGSKQGIDKTRLVASGVFGSAFQGVAGKVASKLDERSTRKLIQEAAPTIENLKGVASEAYKEIDSLGVKLNSGAVSSLVGRLSKIAESNGFEPKIHKQTAVALDTIFDRVSDNGISLGELDRLRRVMQAAGANINQPSDSRLATLLVKQIDDVLDNLPESAIVGAEGVSLSLIHI